jgi:hypothetical protein
VPTDIDQTAGRRAEAAEAVTTTPAVEGGQPLGSAVRPARGFTAAGVTLVALFFAVSVGFVFQGGAYGPSTWLPLLVAVAALLLVVALAGPAVFSGRFQKVLLAVFALQAVWTAVSVFWAGSRSNAWEETNRTLFYALTLVLVFAAVRWAGVAAVKAIAASATVVAGVVAVVALANLALTSDPLSLFVGGRLNYPITYFNGLAALLMVGFWLALGMANGARCSPRADAKDLQPAGAPSDSEEPRSRVAWRRSQAHGGAAGGFPRWSQPLLLVLAVVLLEVALLPQSRGALWTFFLVVPFFVILSPHRFRALVDLVIMVVPVALFWDRLNAPYLAISNETPLNTAINTDLLAIGYSVAIVIGGWAITWLIERWVGSLRRKVVMWVGVGLATLVMFGAAGGVIYADVRTGGLDTYLSDRWQEVTTDAVGDTQGATRFTGVGLNGRLRQWRVALEAFEAEPAHGLGAQNFEAYWYQHRSAAFTVRQPHSQPLQLISELGLPGVILWLVFVVAALVHAAIVRFRSPSWATRVLVAATMTAVLSWFIHSSADWLWQLAGVTLPAMMLFGALVGADKGTGRPRSNEAAVSAISEEEGGPTVDPDAQVTTDAPAAQPQRRRSVRSWRSGRSPLLRALAVMIALAAITSAVLPYLSARYSALAAGASDLEQMTARAQTAAALDPTTTEPFGVRADVYVAAASQAPDASERLRLLRLATTALQEALEREPGSWVYHFQAARTLFAARDAALVADSASVRALEEQARAELAEALRLDPLSPEVSALQAARLGI